MRASRLGTVCMDTVSFCGLGRLEGDSPTIGKRWQKEPMACAMSGFFFLQASASPLLIGFHATAEVASRARTRRVKSLIGKRILKVFAADASWGMRGRIG